MRHCAQPRAFFFMWLGVLTISRVTLQSLWAICSCNQVPCVQGTLVLFCSTLSGLLKDPHRKRDPTCCLSHSLQPWDWAGLGWAGGGWLCSCGYLHFPESGNTWAAKSDLASNCNLELSAPTSLDVSFLSSKITAVPACLGCCEDAVRMQVKLGFLESGLWTRSSSTSQIKRPRLDQANQNLPGCKLPR